MNDLRRRLSRLEARKAASRPAERADQVRHEHRVAALNELINAAWPGRSESLAHCTALILGLPHSAALREVLKGEEIEAVAERTWRLLHGDGWREQMEATAAEAAEACERAHGADWEKQFVAIWRG